MDFNSQIVHRAKTINPRQDTSRTIAAVIAVVVFMLAYLFRLFSQAYFHFDLVKYDHYDVTKVEAGVVPVGEVTQGRVIEQELPPIGSRIEDISIHAATYARTNAGNVILQIKGENDVVYGEKQIAAGQISDDSYISVPLTQSLDYTSDDDLKLVITSTSEAGRAITLYKTENDGIVNRALTIDGMEQEGDIVVRLVTKEYTQLFKSIIILSGCLLALIIYWFLQRKTSNPLILTFSFLLLFAIYALRSPEDFFSSYLWAEDGTVLISGSVLEGFGTIFTPTNGTLWLIQKLLAFVCYKLLSLFNGMKWLPVFQGCVTRLAAVGGIFYFTSDKFSWIVQDRVKRFFICVLITLMLPMRAYDVFTCDTSLPFVLNIVAFYIGLNLLCRETPSSMTACETIFMALLALSTAAAPFVAAVAGLSALRWLIYHVREKDLQPRAAVAEGVKLTLVLCAVLLQLKTIMGGGRVSASIDLPARILLSIQAFVMLPYWQNFNMWALFALSLIGWGGLLYLSKVSWRIVVYCAFFSFGFLLYSSMVTSVQDAYNTLGGEGPRFTLLSYAISTVLLGIVLCRLWERNKTFKPVFCLILSTLLFISLQTYHVPTVGTEFIGLYDRNITLFENHGRDLVCIPIGPWRPWTMSIPSSISEKIVDDDMTIIVDAVDGQFAAEGVSIDASRETVDIIGWASTKDGKPFTHLFLKEPDGTYKAQLSADMRLDVADNLDNDELLHSGFTVNTGISSFTDGTTSLEFVGRTSDGAYHRGVAQVQVSLVK